MKKRITAALSALLLLMLLLSASAVQGEKVYFMSVNDIILDLEDETMPRMVNGVLYVPYTMFDRNSTNGVSLGVFSQYSRIKGAVMIYGAGGTLLFDLNNGTAHFDSVLCDGKAIIRNSMVFVPLDLVCDLFGLSWSWIVMERGDVIRVKSEEVVLSDRDFATAATFAVEARYQKYLQNKNTPQQPTPSEPPADPSPSDSPSVTPAPTPTVPDNQAEAEDARVYLGFRMEDGEGFAAVLRYLEENGVYAVFFCDVEEVAARDEDIRSLLASGHHIGLRLNADTLDGQLDEFREGNRLLSRIAHTQTFLCMSENLARSDREKLTESVCLWQTTLDATPQGRGQTRQVNAVVEKVSPRRTYFALMDDSRQSARALTSILTQLTDRGANFLLATEVTLQN